MKTAVVLFPGQGSQCRGMGRDLAEHDQDAMDLWKKAEQVSGLPLREMYWEGDEAAMNDTKALQPALTCVNCNLYRRLASSFTPLGFAGHSLGEFSALACAKVLEFSDVIELTSVRGELMAGADPQGRGAMAAIVKLPVETVQTIAAEAEAESGEMICLANFNTPAQTVVSGTKKAVELACSKAKALKGRGVLLKVSAAFHSPMMDEANREFQRVLRKKDWHDACAPVYGNVDGKPEVSGQKLMQKMERQMISSVLWNVGIEEQYANAVRAWLEVGPKSLLLKMVELCLGDRKEGCTMYPVTDLAQVNGFVATD